MSKCPVGTIAVGQPRPQIHSFHARQNTDSADARKARLSPPTPPNYEFEY